MLVNKKYADGAVVAFKMVNGDEVIGKLLGQTATHFQVESPMTVIPTQSGIKLVASVFTVEPGKTFDISFDHVMLHHPVADPVADHYREVTTGIKTVRNESRIIV